MRKRKYKVRDAAERDTVSWEDLKHGTIDINLIFENTIGLIWLEFTGISDCEGTEIYEGDILSGNGKNRWIVTFVEGAFIGIPMESNIRIFQHTMLPEHFQESKVWGHIHQ